MTIYKQSKVRNGQTRNICQFFSTSFVSIPGYKEQATNIHPINIVGLRANSLLVLNHSTRDLNLSFVFFVIFKTSSLLGA
jgi:hypothetical protein